MSRDGGKGVALALILLVVPGLAGAYDEVKVTPSVSVTQRWDSNVFNLESGEKDDLSTVVQPQLEIAYDSERTHVETSYGLQSTTYLQYNELDAISHRFNFDASRRLTRRLRASFGANLWIYPKADAFELDAVGYRAGRPDYKTYNMSGGLSYNLDPRSTVSLNLSHTEQDYDTNPQEEAARYDTSVNALTLAYERILSKRDSIGLSLSRSLTLFARDPDSQCQILVALTGSGRPFCLQSVTYDDSESLQHALSASWTRLWSPTWRSSVSLGVRRLESDGGSYRVEDAFLGTTVVDPGSDSSFTWIGSLSLTRKTEVSTLGLSYFRETRPATGRAASVDVDYLSLGYDRRLSTRLRFESDASWTRQQSVYDVEAIDEVSMRLGAGLTWRWTEDLTTFVRIGYRDRTNRNRIAADRAYDDYSLRLGFNYKLPLYLL